MKRKKNTWKVISPKTQEELISFQLKKIAEICSNNIKQIDDIGLYTGLSGIILFLSYYAKHYKSEKYEASVYEAFHKTIDLLKSSEQIPSYCSGVAGAGWMIMHLKEKGWIDIETDDFFEDIDNYLHAALINDLEIDNYDFLHGYLGIFYYYLERLKFNVSPKTKRFVYEIIQMVFNKIKDKAIRCKEGVKWKSKVSENSNVIGYNLGLAHGIPSIINILSKFPPGTNENDIKKLILSGIRYINSTKLNSSNLSLYSNFIKVDGMDSGRSRMGWCYGDLGIGITFLHAVKSIPHHISEDEALHIFNHSIHRIENNGVKDACFCHGTAGIFHIFNRVYQETGIVKYKNISNYWIKETLDILEGDNGYRTWFGSTGWQNEYSLLEGVSGVGISLLASISDEYPDWDRCFLVS